MHNGHIGSKSETKQVYEIPKLVAPTKPYQLWVCTLSGELRAVPTGDHPASDRALQHWTLVTPGSIEGL